MNPQQHLIEPREEDRVEDWVDRNNHCPERRIFNPITPTGRQLQSVRVGPEARFRTPYHDGRIHSTFFATCRTNMLLYPECMEPFCDGKDACSEHQSICMENTEDGNATTVVYTHGVCPEDGQPQAIMGLGVYFGPNSTYNMSQSCDPLQNDIWGNQTTQRAELWAVIRALELLRDRVAPDRIRRIHRDFGCSDHCRNLFTLRAVIVTHSLYLVELICSDPSQWTWTGSTYYTWHEAVGTNLHLFKKILEGMFQLATLAIKVEFHHVPPSENSNADALARLAMTDAIEERCISTHMASLALRS